MNPFRRGLVRQRTNWKSQKLSTGLKKKAENLPGLSNSLKSHGGGALGSRHDNRDVDYI